MTGRAWMCLLGLVSMGGCAGDVSSENVEQDDALSDAASSAVVGLAGKCLDVRGGSSDNGTAVQLWPCNGTAAQRWHWSGRSLVGVGGKCLDVRDASSANGARLQLWDCHGSDNQQFTYQDSQLRTPDGRCVDVVGASTMDGTPLQVWSCWGGANQTWKLGSRTPVPTTDLSGWRLSLSEDFQTPAETGAKVKSTYAQSFCAYDDNAKYKQANLSVKDGSLAVALDGRTGAAGVFAPGGCDGAWKGTVYGRYALRFRAVEAGGNGAAVMVWPNSNVWGDGEIDFPEGDFASTIQVNHHPMGCEECGTADSHNTLVGFQEWHVATVEWAPGRVTYGLDGRVVKTVTHDVPKTPHRFTFQTAPDKAKVRPGQFLIDWVAIWTRSSN